MSDQYVQQQLCKKLDDFGTVKAAKNTMYRKLWNWEGESRWTLLFNIYETLQQAADFVNSVMPTNPLLLDSLPARYTLKEKFTEYKKEQEVQLLVTQREMRVEKEKKDSSERKKPKKRSPTETVEEPATSSATTTSIAQEAILVAKNVDRVLSMRSLHESLQNAKIAIAQFCNKKRYKNDELLVPLLFSLLNSANQVAQRIEVFLNELKAM